MNIDKLADKNTFKDNNRLNVFETFAGIGSQHKALTNLENKKILQFEIVATSEWYVYAILAYCKIHYSNLNNENNYFRDKRINNISLSLNSKDPFPIKKFLKKDNNFVNLVLNSFFTMKNKGSIVDIKGSDLKEHKIDILTYSFPCQDLSTAGSFWNKNMGMDKKLKNRSSLIWQIGRILEELKNINKLPKVLVMENVKAILNKKNIESFKKWKLFLSELGYKTYEKKLLGIDFGIPQKRERIIAISFLKKFKFSYEIWDLYQNEYINKYVNHNNNDLKFFLKKNYENKEILLEAIKQTPNFTPSRIIMYEKCKNLNNSNYCWTISTKQDRFPNAGIIPFLKDEKKYFKEKNSKFRFLTPRECFLLMGFSENDYEKIRSLNLSYSVELLLAGNSIIVNIMESVFFVINKIIGK